MNMAARLLPSLLRALVRSSVMAKILVWAVSIATEIWLSVTALGYTGALIDALAGHDGARFQHTLWKLLLVALVHALLIAANLYLNDRVAMEARSSLVDGWLPRWLDGEVLYRIEREHALDNPDQRIAEDLKLFVDKTLALGSGFYVMLLGVGTYATLLWEQGGAFGFTLGGRALAIPGYLFWMALVFACVGTVLSRWIGKPLVNLTMRQQRVEADFRFGLIQAREHAEQVALWRGGEAEYERATGRFEQIRRNWWRLAFFQVRLQVATLGFTMLPMYCGYLLMAPKVLDGAMTVGAMTMLSAAFGSTVTRLNWPSMVWGEVVQWMAAVKRLGEMDGAIAEPASRADPRAEIRVLRSGAAAVTVQRLALCLPDGTALTGIAELQLRPGERWLLRGPSGVGKSTLLRALAGLWPHGRGTIGMPAQGVMFVPQKDYLPWGTLKAALAYPQRPEAYGDEACRQALIDVRLPQWVDRLHERERWSLQLSPGEQQRLAFARVLLARPAFLFLDESTSALDLDTERHLYQLLLKRLPLAALVSVAHRSTLDAFHDHRLLLASARPAAADDAPLPHQPWMQNA
ncbi:ABC transporter ATP-binding protein/permease [Pelomonas sp. KK5]|uniref:ABC transporter ATP-binding protein/permease n=1 Tax=Pelomonas sp. KK5 TaxID=1855730 RepID=UPI0009F92953|nr:ABC transporter ATP-binding protein/permease [Pelomonas sp. KK5]